jgi:putative membrane protein
MLKRTFISAAIIAVVCLPSVAFAQATSSADFVQKASIGNAFEVQEGQLAAKSATDPKLKAFGAMMVKDHSAAQKKLEAAAKSGGSAEPSLDADHQAMLDALKAKSGSDFDKGYVADQKQAHNDAAQLLGSYQTDGSDKRLQAWAKKTLPTVKMHLSKINTF